MAKPAEPDHGGRVHVRRRYTHFAMVPVYLVKSKAISAQAVRAFALLDSYCSWDTNKAHPAHDRLADDMGVSVPTLRRAIKELVDAGFVSLEGVFDDRGARVGTIYTLMDPQDNCGTQVDGQPSQGDSAPVITGDHPSLCSPVITGVVTDEQPPDHGCHPINKDSVLSAVLPSEDKPMEVTPASGSGSETKTIEAGASSARTQARVNSARVKAQPNPDVRPMLQRHAQCYQDKVGAPYPISWAKEGAIVKRLLATYSRDELVLLQDTFFAQKADSQTALRGYTVQWLEHEAPALMARIQLQNGLTAEQREVIAALVAEGVTEPTATALASEYRVEDIRRQLHAHAARKDRLRSPAAALVKAIREGWQVPEESEPDYYRPLRLAAASDGTPVGPPPEEIRVQLERTIAHLVGR